MNSRKITTVKDKGYLRACLKSQHLGGKTLNNNNKKHYPGNPALASTAQLILNIRVALWDTSFNLRQARLNPVPGVGRLE